MYYLEKEVYAPLELFSEMKCAINDARAFNASK